MGGERRGGATPLHLCKWHVHPMVVLLLLLLLCFVVAYILIMRLVLCYTYFTLLSFHISSQQHATRNPRGTCPATQPTKPTSPPLNHPTTQNSDPTPFIRLAALPSCQVGTWPYTHTKGVVGGGLGLGFRNRGVHYHYYLAMR